VNIKNLLEFSKRIMLYLEHKGHNYDFS